MSKTTKLVTDSEVEVDASGALVKQVRLGGQYADLRMTIYPPSQADRDRGKAYHRIKWHENGRIVQTTAGPRWADAKKKVATIVQRVSTDADKASQSVSEMTARYLDPKRKRGKRLTPWSAKHHDTQKRLIDKYVVKKIGRVRCQDLTTKNLQDVLDSGPSTAGERARLLGTLRALVRDGWDQRYLVKRPDDLLRGLSLSVGADDEDDVRTQGVHVDAVSRDEIPGHEDVALFAHHASKLRGAPWWFELMPYVAAYSGLRLGELLALTKADVDTRPSRRIRVEWQITEVAGKPQPKTRPKGRKKRTTTFPETTPPSSVWPDGYPLTEKLRERMKEVGKNDRLFPTASGGLWYRNNFARRYFAPSAKAAGWARDDDDRWIWTWHSLRHVFCTYYLWDRKASPRDVADAAGHSTVSTTLNLYGTGRAQQALDRLEPPAPPVAKKRSAKR